MGADATPLRWRHAAAAVRWRGCGRAQAHSASTRDARGLSPLAHAVARRLAGSGASAARCRAPTRAETPRGASLLHLAAALGAVRAARLLLARPGGSALLRDAEQRDARWTPLHAAAAAARPEALAAAAGLARGRRCGAGCACRRRQNRSGLLRAGARRLADAGRPSASGCCCPARRRRGGGLAGAVVADAEVLPPPQPVDPSRASAKAFAALSRDLQSKRLERWADARGRAQAAMLPSPPPDFPGPGAAAYSHVAAQARVRLDASLR
jgi:hypothetical protein